jgi:signal transduction histidine kinase
MNLMSSRLADAQETRLKTLEELRHAERLNTVGKLASGLAHELGTPLSVIILRAKGIASGKRWAIEQVRESAQSIAEQATRMTNLVRELLDFARRRTPERAPVHMEGVVAKTKDFLSTVSARTHVRIESRRRARSDLVVGDAAQLQQVITNLLMNAVQAMPAGGIVEVRLDDVRAKQPADRGGGEGEFLRIQVRDQGPGIPREILPRVFEPFFTTKDVGEGTGLGLSVCYGIVRDHNGWIEVDSALGGGSTFSIFLPQSEPS